MQSIDGRFFSPRNDPSSVSERPWYALHFNDCVSIAAAGTIFPKSLFRQIVQFMVNAPTTTTVDYEIRVQRIIVWLTDGTAGPALTLDLTVFDPTFAQSAHRILASHQDIGGRVSYPKVGYQFPKRIRDTPFYSRIAEVDPLFTTVAYDATGTKAVSAAYRIDFLWRTLKSGDDIDPPTTLELSPRLRGPPTLPQPVEEMNVIEGI